VSSETRRCLPPVLATRRRSPFSSYCVGFAARRSGVTLRGNFFVGRGFALAFGGLAGTVASTFFCRAFHGERLVFRDGCSVGFNPLLANTLENPGEAQLARYRVPPNSASWAVCARRLRGEGARSSAQIACGFRRRRLAATSSPSPLPSAVRRGEACALLRWRFFQRAGPARSWIDAALGPFNAVEHAELTQPYLDLALAALPEFKRTRKDLLRQQLAGRLRRRTAGRRRPRTSGELRKPA